jgi:predicted DNA binding CopG/RHH family protein
MGGSDLRLSGPEDRLDKTITLRINSREAEALALIAKDMGLPPQEAIRSLLLTSALEIKPKPKR